MALNIVATFTASGHDMPHDVDLNGDSDVPQGSEPAREIQRERSNVEKLVRVIASVASAGVAVLGAVGAVKHLMAQQVTYFGADRTLTRQCCTLICRLVNGR